MTTALLFEFPADDIFLVKKRRSAVAMGFMAFLQSVSDSCPCGRIPQNAALLLAKTSDGPPTIE